MGAITTYALLLESRPVRDTDVHVTVFTEQLGVVVAHARAARTSRRRMPALEALHLLDMRLDDRGSEAVAFVSESAVAVPRIGILRSAERLNAAGRALRWVRAGVPQRAPEPEVWRATNVLLDQLAGSEDLPRVQMATFGLRLLRQLGWALDFTSCVRCGLHAPDASAGCVCPTAGGLVCRACGGSPTVLRARQRSRFASCTLEPEDVRLAVALVDATLAAHAELATGHPSRVVQC